MASALDEHKVRGGSVLSVALAKGSPTGQLDTSSPVDSTASAESEHAAAWLSSSGGSTQLASPQPAGDALAQAAADAEPRHQQQQHRRRMPFLSCFTASGVHGQEDMSQPAAVWSSEVGIRPCFYWLESPGGLSDEDLMFAEANARWLKSDCQDEALVIEHFGGLSHQTFAGVFDGHGPYGRHAAKFASTRLPQLLAAKLAGAGSERRRLRALRDSFLELNASMRDPAAAGFDASLSGTTACVALVVGRRVLVASAGDSRCVVARRGPGGELEAVPLTWDAKPSLPDEQHRILMAGGVVKQLLDEGGQRCGAYRVFRRGDDVLPGLAMSRSLGDLYAHAVGVSPEPVLNSYTLGERDLFVVLASDGLWDIMGSEAAADFVARYTAAREPGVSCAEALTLEAQERWKALHEEAIVDDISCVILHTAAPPAPSPGRGPAAPELPRPLARAASCNDEANELYAQWRLERDRSPSHSKPQQYFKHLYREPGDEDEGPAAAPRAPPRRQASSPRPVAAPAAPTGEQAAGTPPTATSAGPPLPPVSPYIHDAPQYSSRPALQRSDSSSASSAAAAAAALPSPRRGPGGEGRASSGALHRMDDISSQSPHSSYGDLGSEASEPSTRRGGAFTAAWCEVQLQRSSGPQPIPLQRRGSSEDGPLSLPLEALLRPVRKAYPSTSNFQSSVQLCSYRSDASLAAADTPRSGDSSHLERKVRGGMSRSASAHRLPGSHASASSMLTSCRASADMLSSGRRSAQDERQAASSASSPGGDLLLSASAQPSPQPSPVVVPLGAYSRVAAGPGGAARALHPAPPPTGITSLQHGRPPPAARVAELVQSGMRLSRTATDCAALVEAAVVVGAARRPPPGSPAVQR